MKIVHFSRKFHKLGKTAQFVAVLVLFVCYNIGNSKIVLINYQSQIENIILRKEKIEYGKNNKAR